MPGRGVWLVGLTQQGSKAAASSAARVWTVGGCSVCMRFEIHAPPVLAATVCKQPRLRLWAIRPRQQHSNIICCCCCAASSTAPQHSRVAAMQAATGCCFLADRLPSFGVLCSRLLVVLDSCFER